MASPSFLPSSKRPDLNVCARCAFRACQAPSKVARRWIGMKYLAKVANAEAEWEEKAKLIRSGKQKSMLNILEERRLVQTITGKRQALDKKLTDKRIGAYVGIDPTGPSLHVGHLLPLMSLFWMYVHGYHTVSLLGGATAKIGDPTDRLTSREHEMAAIRTMHMVNIHMQLKVLWVNVEAYGKRYGYNWEWAWHRELVNNNAWWNKLPMLEVLQVLGPGMRMGTMLARETVQNKMKNGDGMSYAEFSYPIMQSWDWWHMYRTKGIHMQIGGADQFGNIIAGIDAVNYISTHHRDPAVVLDMKAMDGPCGLTVPLLTTSSGQKFGKSAGNAVWLDKEKTSAFDLYGYFLRTSDADVGKFLKMFTFMPIEDINTLIKEHEKSPEQRKAQHQLARELLEIVHGPVIAKETEKQHRFVFSKGSTQALAPSAAPENAVDDRAVHANTRPAANIRLPRRLIYQRSIGKILYASGLTDSASDGHRLAAANGAYIGGHPNVSEHKAMNDGFIQWVSISNWTPETTSSYLIHGDLLLLRRSKYNIRIIQVVSDEEYAQSKDKYPGMEKWWKRDVLRAMAVRETLTDLERNSVEKLLAEEESILSDSSNEASEGGKGKVKGKKLQGEKVEEVADKGEKSQGTELEEKKADQHQAGEVEKKQGGAA